MLHFFCFINYLYYICEEINLKKKIIMAYLLKNKDVHYRTLDSGLTVINEGLCVNEDWINCTNATIFVNGSLKIESNEFYIECKILDLFWGWHFDGYEHIHVKDFNERRPQWTYNTKDVKINTKPSTIFNRPLEDFFKFGKVYDYEYLEFDTKIRKKLNKKFVEFSHWKLNINE